MMKLDIQNLVEQGKVAPATAPATEQVITRAYMDTDYADMFVARYDYAYSNGLGWLRWCGTHWQATGAPIAAAKVLAQELYADIGTYARDIIDKEKLRAACSWITAANRTRNIIAMLRLVQDMTCIDDGKLDADPDLLNCANGTLNLRSGAMQPHDKRDLITHYAPYIYSKQPICPNWLAFLEQIQPDDAMRRFLQQAFGLSMRGRFGDAYLFFAYGVGANGKSTLLETVARAFGSYSERVKSESLLDEYKQSGAATPELARLRGKRLVISGELPEGRYMNESLVKDLTGGDTMTARMLHCNPITYKPAYQLWMQGNHKPAIRGTDNGIWRRMILIPFETILPHPDKDYAETHLMTELNGIFSWLANGWLVVARAGRLDIPQQCIDATQAYRTEQDTLGQFITECLIIGSGSAVPSGVLYTRYKSYCDDNGLKPLSNKAIKQRLTERGYRCERINAGMYWHNIALV